MPPAFPLFPLTLTGLWEEREEANLQCMFNPLSRQLSSGLYFNILVILHIP